jgi:hypothetical protein
MMKKALSLRLPAVAGSLAVLLVAGAASAQALSLDTSVIPHSGVVVGASNFAPNPYEVSVTGGGAIDLQTVDATAAVGAAGWVDAIPNFRFVLGTDAEDLSFLLTPASDDTVLLVMGPDGSFYFNADYVPVIDIQSADAGQYDVWVGSLSGGTPSGVLQVTHP